ERRIFVREGCGWNIPVNFVTGDMNETMDLQLASGLEKNQGASDIGLNGVSWLGNTAVNVGFSGKVNHSIAAGHGSRGGGGIANITFYELVVGISGERVEIRKVS